MLAMLELKKLIDNILVTAKTVFDLAKEEDELISIVYRNFSLSRNCLKGILINPNPSTINGGGVSNAGPFIRGNCKFMTKIPSSDSYINKVSFGNSRK